jgi:hypothetical protein
MYSYSARGIPYNLAAPGTPIEALIVRNVGKFLENGINMLTGHQAARIDPAKQTVHGTTLDGRLSTTRKNLN